jgi:FtsX-like permease family protein
MRSLRGWLSDLGLGVRLAVGGGRTSMARVLLGAVGIAIATAVLLTAASVGNINKERELRSYATVPNDQPVAGVEPLWSRSAGVEFRDDYVQINYLYATGDSSPTPPGVRELPKPGEVVASPGLAELLGSPAGELLRPRVPGKIVGEVGQFGVGEPGDLVAYIGADAELADPESATEVYGYGMPVAPTAFDPALLAVVLVGAVALLVPVFIFVSSSSRIAGAERDRRLSALRLVGSGSRQVRRIAAAESLVSAVLGLVLGGVIFAILRQYAESFNLFDTRVYVSDVAPAPVLVALIVVAVPLLSVLTAQFALRRTIIEPLGVVRRGKPVKRRAWWRFALIVLGVALLVTQGGAREDTDPWAFAVATGAALLLIGVPVLLPWVVERVAGRLHGGPTSWQLAIRRLQLDSGTPARVVGGVAVVLSGAIALQALLLTAEQDVGLNSVNSAPRDPVPRLEVSADDEIAPSVLAELGAAPGVRSVHEVRNDAGYLPGEENAVSMAVLDCAALRDLAGVKDCTDGQVFRASNDAYMPQPDAVDLVAKAKGKTIEFRKYDYKTADFDPNEYDIVGTWQVPGELPSMRVPEYSGIYSDLIVTPAALAGATLSNNAVTVDARLADVTSDELETIRNSVAEFSWQVNVYSMETKPDLSSDQALFVAIRTALLAGSVFTLALAGVSLLVLALEQIRERRRPLAVLAASGVQRGVLGRSLLWQVVLPIALGVLVAVLTGLLLAWLVIDVIVEVPLIVDWPGVGMLSGIALLLGVLVTAITLPFLRSATRLTALRTE